MLLEARWGLENMQAQQTNPESPIASRGHQRVLRTVQGELDDMYVDEAEAIR